MRVSEPMADAAAASMPPPESVRPLQPEDIEPRAVISTANKATQ